MSKFEKILSGGDLRSLGKSGSIIVKVHNQDDFDELFKYVFYKDRVVVMRTIDTIEKITINHPRYLAKHKDEIMKLCTIAKDKELKWHLALLIPRLYLSGLDFVKAWDMLTKWANDKGDSRLVRVGAIQGLFEMTKQNINLTEKFNLIMQHVEKERIPSINARIRNIRKEMV